MSSSRRFSTVLSSGSSVLYLAHSPEETSATLQPQYADVKLTVQNAQEVLSSLAGSSFDHILSSSSLPAATLTDLLGLLRPGGSLVIAMQGGAAEEAAKMDLILSGFVDVAAAAKSGDSVELVAQRPPWAENASVPLNLKKKAVPAPAASAPAKDVWNLAADDTNDLDLVGEDDLLARDPVVLPVKVAADCGPAAEGQKKKACKNCSCGLAEQQQAEEKGGAQFSNAKPISSCGSVSGSCDICGLGDAFRCATCPYLGKPAFATSTTGAVKLQL